MCWKFCLKTLLLLATFFVDGSVVYGVFFQKKATEDLLLKNEVVARIDTLKAYAPDDVYRWDFWWNEEKRYTKGWLTGCVDKTHHWVEVSLGNGDVLFFDKNNPVFCLYPHRFCICPTKEWLKPLRGHRSLCCFLIMMPFLHWPIKYFDRTAKMGRRSIQVVFEKGGIQVEIFLDRTFNAILQANVLEEHRVLGSFILKHFKRFPQGWNLGQIEYVLDGFRSYMNVVSVKNGKN